MHSLFSCALHDCQSTRRQARRTQTTFPHSAPSLLYGHLPTISDTTTDGAEDVDADDLTASDSEAVAPEPPPAGQVATEPAATESVEAKAPRRGRGYRDVPMPRLLTQQLYATLDAMRVEVVACEGEADRDLARASANDPTGRTFVLGDDSDFFIFAGCRYIRFREVKVKRAKAHARRRAAACVAFAFLRRERWASSVPVQPQPISMFR